MSLSSLFPLLGGALIAISASATAATINGHQLSNLPVVTTTAGMINGGLCPNNSDAAFFKGIPYAQPPVGDLRFSAPEAYNATYPIGGLDALVAVPACIQFGQGFGEFSSTSEDCLYIDVYKPIDANDASELPVRVFLYGGFDQAGGMDDPLYDGCDIASTGAVMVTLNYRVGPLGFFALPDAGFSGNQGIQDIILALRWVQDNIAAFGGAPSKVLVHGQSAGALNAFIIASLVEGPSLMNSAIFESSPSMELPAQEVVIELASQYAVALECTSTLNITSCLQAKSVSELSSVYETLPLLNSRKFPLMRVSNASSPLFDPSIDGSLVLEQPSLRGARVPSIFGTNSMEGTLFAFLTFGKQYANVTEQDYYSYLEENFGCFSAKILEFYPYTIANLSQYSGFYAMSQVLTTAMFTCANHRSLRATAAAGIPVWTYLFAHDPNCDWISALPPASLPLLGSTHTAELPFIFGTTKNLPAPNGTCAMTPSESELSEFMVQAWTSMAANGSPATSQQWPLFDHRSLGLYIDDLATPRVFNYSTCELWDAIAYHGFSH